jgi:uncharacterized protein YkwD
MGVVALAVAVTTMLTALAPASASTSASRYAGARAGCPREGTRAMVCYHRRARVIAHVHTLRRDHRLDRSAALKSVRIVRCRQHRHSPCGETWYRPFYKAGYVPRGGGAVVGENLAWGWPTAWAAFEALMRSPRHRSNILDSDFRDVGARLVRRSPWGPLWVIHYGRREAR